MTRRRLFQVLATVIGAVCLLVLSGVLSAQGNSDNAFERVKEVQERHTAKLMAKEGVVGTAVGLDEQNKHAMIVLLEKPGIAGIPQELDGVPVHQVVTGKFYALAKPPKPTPSTKIDPKKRFERPVPIGISTGNILSCSSGTIGCRVSGSGSVYALSNNHVYALENRAAMGTDVVQPGRYDNRPPCATKTADIIGTLAAFVPISFGDDSVNYVDAALATTNEQNLGTGTPNNGYGVPLASPVTAFIGQAVQKYGRTTGLTKGHVESINATVTVGYDSGTAVFYDQIIVTPGTFSGAGDSGSLIVSDPEGAPVGLLFAGSYSHTVANQIGRVLQALDVSIDVE